MIYNQIVTWTAFAILAMFIKKTQLRILIKKLKPQIWAFIKKTPFLELLETPVIVIPIVIISIEPTFFWRSCTREGCGRNRQSNCHHRHASQVCYCSFYFHPNVTISNKRTVKLTFFWRSCSMGSRGRVEIIKAIVIIDMVIKFAIVLVIFILMSSFPTNARWN